MVEGYRFKVEERITCSRPLTFNLQLFQDGDLIAGVELGAIHAFTPDFGADRPAVDAVKAVAIEKFGDERQRTDLRDPALFRRLDQPVDEKSAHAFAMLIGRHGQRADLHQVWTEMGQIRATDHAPPVFRHQEIAQGMAHLRWRAIEHQVLLGKAIDQVADRLNIILIGGANIHGGRLWAEDGETGWALQRCGFERDGEHVGSGGLGQQGGEAVDGDVHLRRGDD